MGHIEPMADGVALGTFLAMAMVAEASEARLVLKQQADRHAFRPLRQRFLEEPAQFLLQRPPGSPGGL